MHHVVVVYHLTRISSKSCLYIGRTSNLCLFINKPNCCLNFKVTYVGKNLYYYFELKLGKLLKFIKGLKYFFYLIFHFYPLKYFFNFIPSFHIIDRFHFSSLILFYYNLIHLLNVCLGVRYVCSNHV